jgi:hypothetical protein
MTLYPIMPGPTIRVKSARRCGNDTRGSAAPSNEAHRETGSSSTPVR